MFLFYDTSGNNNNMKNKNKHKHITVTRERPKLNKQLTTCTEWSWPLFNGQTRVPWHWHPIIQAGARLIHTDALNRCCHRPAHNTQHALSKTEWITAEIKAALPGSSWKSSNSEKRGSFAWTGGSRTAPGVTSWRLAKQKLKACETKAESVAQLRASSCCRGQCQVPWGPRTSGLLVWTIPHCVMSAVCSLSTKGENEKIQLHWWV